MAEGKADFHSNSILDKASQENGKLDKSSPLAQLPKCPQCGSRTLYKDGLRYLTDGTTVQRWWCRECRYRFTEKKPLQKKPSWQINTASTSFSKRQVCELLTEESKNLAEVTRQEQAQREGTLETADAKGKIIEFVWWMQKQGYREATIFTNSKQLSTLTKRGANLLDPESVKAVIAHQSWVSSQKHKAVAIYTLFLKMLGRTWEPPIYKPIPKIPFIPTEKEVDDLIAGTGKKLSAYLQLLKETGMRSGEADQLNWIDLDFERNVVTITPEKNSYPRILPLSLKCIAMLNNLEKTSNKVFGNLTPNAMRVSLCNTRKKLTRKLGNPRLEQIHFHTIRHWKATTLYHQTKDILYVKQFMGHRRIESTLVYVQIESALFVNTSQDFTCKVAETKDEIQQLVEAGFEYVLQQGSLAYFRKRK